MIVDYSGDRDRDRDRLYSIFYILYSLLYWDSILGVFGVFEEYGIP
ncbi:MULTISPECIES: hypothetical protein [Planktothricoides]|uniref:Transposase n=2 Tax=Planktothricoides raciborskii TaxID=132608 RepID=A0AAU8JBZ5_9CYAN|nr:MULTISPECIES: hypothetical protein [Planktothricoides]MBD2545892.1 hypothetical protein [Planktothricoides raciborskii FACHB-1370]MBD2584150.1 hypothetical protein [Planktothricoides raciborskii FACHB-1261]